MGSPICRSTGLRVVRAFSSLSTCSLPSMPLWSDTHLRFSWFQFARNWWYVRQLQTSFGLEGGKALNHQCYVVHWELCAFQYLFDYFLTQRFIAWISAWKIWHSSGGFTRSIGPFLFLGFTVQFWIHLSKYTLFGFFFQTYLFLRSVKNFCSPMNQVSYQS